MFGIGPKVIVVIVFILVYIYLIFIEKYKSLIAWIGVGILTIIGIVNFKLIVHAIEWNVMGILIGTLFVAELFIYSRVPELFANYLVKRSTTVGAAILWVCMMSSFVSAFIENVATVLIVAPVAIELAKKLKTSPVPFVIGIAISSNLQGSATLIGDPPSMILAGYEKMSFNDFFFFKDKPGIFFAVQVGALVSFFVLYFLFKKYKQKVAPLKPVQVITWIPTYILVLMILGLAFSPIWDPNFSYLGGLICLSFGVLGWVVHFIRNRQNGKQILSRLDYDTVLFLAAIFILVYVLEHISIIEDIKNFIMSLTAGNKHVAFTLIISFSILFSAFICNIPYVTAMIPVVHRLGLIIDNSPYFLVFGLLIGACLGGNITPIGASANIVGAGLSKKIGHPIKFIDFVKIGLPFTIAATVAGSLFLLIFWG